MSANIDSQWVHKNRAVFMSNCLVKKKFFAQYHCSSMNQNDRQTNTSSFLTPELINNRRWLVVLFVELMMCIVCRNTINDVYCLPFGLEKVFYCLPFGLEKVFKERNYN